MRKERGFTLIELMVASALLLSLLVAYLGAYQNVFKTAEYNQGIALASLSCVGKLEEVLSHDFGSIKTDYGAGGTPGNTFDFNVAGVLNLTGKGTITVTDQPALYGGGENQATAAAGWGTRELHTSLVYDNKMWVIGGSNGITRLNDVWYSTDGINWAPATSAAAWSPRAGHTSLVYDNKMWVMGGQLDDNSTKNDVWYSTDGINWAQATSAAAWSPRVAHASLVYNNKMWVMGGSGNDVWYSTDGINWTQATSAAAWSARWFLKSVVYDNKMWVLGGEDFVLKNDVWCSTDGATWTQATASAAWSPRRYHTTVVYDNKMWVMGGGGAPSPRKNDVWYSTDGVTWICATTSAAWSPRCGHGSLVYDNKMWVMGGDDGSPLKRDVWYSVGYDRLLEIVITLCWRQHDGRIFGEDTNLNGVLDPGEDVNPTNGRLDSPVQLRILVSERNMDSIRKLFLGRN